MNYLNQLTKTLDKNYAKTPVLPKKWTDLLVKFAPILVLIGGVVALVFGVLGLVASLSLFGLATSVAPLGAYGATYGAQYMLAAVVGAVILLATGGLFLLAYPSLKARKVKGWNLLLYTVMLGVVGSIFTLNIFSIVVSVIVALIEYYFLYQIKSYYK